MFNKYCREAGPIQAINITYEKKKDIQILHERIFSDNTEIDFIGNLIEEKIINANINTSLYIRTRIDNIAGTLYVKGNIFNDLILEFQ